METLTASAEVNNNETQKLKEKHEEADCDILDEEALLANPSSITVTDPEEWLCVAKLPPSTNEESFLDLLSEFGSVKESFLVVSSRTGQFKGYGFACFNSKVAALQARHVLEGQEVDGHVVDVSWLKEGVHQLTDLQSKVLYVDKLPSGFRDLAQFRKLFSTIVNPPYCQIAQKNGVLHDWGLVEFNTSEQAEDTMETLKNAQLDNQPIRVQYCIPNNHAINIYMSFVNNPAERTEKKALMDETPSKDVYNQLQSLSKHNPWFVQSLQSIMTQNILAEDHPQLHSSSPAPVTDTDSSNNTSNQAVLALLLAAYLKPSQGLQQGAASLSQLIKQLEAGTSAVELLKNALAPGLNTVTSSAPGHDLSSLISSMTSLVSQGKLPSPTTPVTPNTKNPQLMNMLYSAFQARMSKVQASGSEHDSSSPSSSPSQVSPTPSEPRDQAPAPAQVPPAPPAPVPGDGLLATPPPPVYHGYMYQQPPAHWPYPLQPPPAPQEPSPTTPVSSQSKTMNQFLSMPPPPPPGAPSYPPAPDQWSALMSPAPGAGLLYSPLLTQTQVWPQQQPHIYIQPPQPAQPHQKRKVEEFMTSQGYPEAADNHQILKRQKLC